MKGLTFRLTFVNLYSCHSAACSATFIFVIPTEPAASGERRDLLFLLVARPFSAASKAGFMGIVTSNMAAAQRFTEGVDAAAVMVNASTSFTDGEQFGFGAEIGISTQKLHARGPMGLPELTSTKWIVWGDGQTRPA